MSSEFYIVDTVGPNILGLQTSTKLNLVKINCAIKENNQINSGEDLKQKNPYSFDKIGKFPGKAKIILKDNAYQVVQLPENTPYKFKMNLN